MRTRLGGNTTARHERWNPGGGGRKKVVKMEISKINAKPGKMGDGFVYQATLIFSLTFKGISFALR